MAQLVKNPLANAGAAREVGLVPGPGRPPWKRKWQPTPIFFLGKSHGQRSLAGYSPWGRKKSDMPERARKQQGREIWSLI